MPDKPVGWRKDSARHGLAAKGIKTGNKKEMSIAEMDKRKLVFWAGKDKTYYLRRYPYPGRFEGGFVIDEFIYELTMGGDYVGDMEFGQVASFVPLDDENALKDMEEIAEDISEAPLTDEERAFISHMAGAIVTEDDQGFIDVEYFETKAGFDQTIEAIEEKWEKFYREELPEDDGGY